MEVVLLSTTRGTPTTEIHGLDADAVTEEQ
jgi:hypothetical protein